jgi:hypothetical protein
MGVVILVTGQGVFLPRKLGMVVGFKAGHAVLV